MSLVGGTRERPVLSANVFVDGLHSQLVDGSWLIDFANSTPENVILVRMRWDDRLIEVHQQIDMASRVCCGIGQRGAWIRRWRSKRVWRRRARLS